jgi:hypothetical protein
MRAVVNGYGALLWLWLRRKHLSVQRKTCPSATLSTTNPICIAMALIPGFRIWNPDSTSLMQLAWSHYVPVCSICLHFWTVLEWLPEWSKSRNWLLYPQIVFPSPNFTGGQKSKDDGHLQTVRPTFIWTESRSIYFLYAFHLMTVSVALRTWNVHMAHTHKTSRSYEAHTKFSLHSVPQRCTLRRQ